MQNSQPLTARAAELRDAIESYFIDENGILRYNININTMKPFTEEELEPYEVACVGGGKAARWTYEDSMFCSGYYILSLVEEYRVTKDEAVRKKADKFFDDLLILINECQTVAPGYIGKPWGGVPSDNTNVEQTGRLIFGLHEYHSITDNKRKSQIDRIITTNTDWWISRDYKNYQTPDDAVPCELLPGYVGAMMTQVYLAYLHGGDRKYRDECERLIRQYSADQFPARLSSQWMPVDENGMKIRRIALWHTAIGHSLWLLTKYFPEGAPWWRERFADNWHKDIKLGLGPDGMTAISVRVNLATETELPFKPEEAGFYGEITDWHRQHNALGWFWIGAEKSGHFSAFMALMATMLADAAPWMRAEAQKTAHSILTQVGLRQLCWGSDSDGTQTFEKRAHRNFSLSSKAISPWLAAYWMGRRTGLVAPEL